MYELWRERERERAREIEYDVKPYMHKLLVTDFATSTHMENGTTQVQFKNEQPLPVVVVLRHCRS